MADIAVEGSNPWAAPQASRPRQLRAGPRITRDVLAPPTRDACRDGTRRSHRPAERLALALDSRELALDLPGELARMHERVR